MGKTSKLNLGLIGLGRWGKILESKLREIGNVKFACSGRDASAYQTKLKDVDWVFIATPTHTHAQFVEEAINAGKNVFSEKPLSGNYEISRRLYDLADKKGVKLYVDDVFLWGDQVRDLAKLAKGAQNLEVMWKKSGGGADTIFNALTYHDLTILDKITGGISKFEFREFRRKDEHSKRFNAIVNGIEVHFIYDREYNGRVHQISRDGNVIYDQAKQKNDALNDMLSGVINGKVDYNSNKERTLRIERILEELSKK